jgi:SSS family solute:Na+ symporter
MFWRRATGNGAFFGLIAGTGAAAVHHGISVPAGAATLIKGGWLGAIVHTYPSEMAQNFWTAIVAWVTCFVVTIIVSLLTERRKTDDELRGLVYSLTPRIKDVGLPWYKEPATLGIAVLVAAMTLYVFFW